MERGKKEILSNALAGDEMTNNQFRALMREAEKSPSITLQEAKEQWEVKKQRFLQLAKVNN